MLQLARVARDGDIADGTFFAPAVGFHMECFFALPVALWKGRVEGCFCGFLDNGMGFGSLEERVEGINKEGLVACCIMARGHSVSRGSLGSTVGDREDDCVCGAVADTFAAVGEDAKVPLSRCLFRDRKTRYVFCILLAPFLIVMGGKHGRNVLMLSHDTPNSVSPEAAPTALMPPVVRANVNFFRCGTENEISLTVSTSFPLFNGAAPASASSAETSLLTFRFLTAGSGDGGLRERMYFPMSWRRVEYLGSLAIEIIFPSAVSNPGQCNGNSKGAGGG